MAKRPHFDLDPVKGRHQFPRAKPGKETQQFSVHIDRAGSRLDHLLMSRFPGYSRSFLQSLIKEGRVLVDGRKPKASASIGPQNEITVHLPEGAPRDPENLELEVVYRDEFVLAINKRPGLVIHPCRGHRTGTVLQGLFHIFRKEIEADPLFKVGSVHRIDQGTSGVLLCAWGDSVLRFVQSQFEHRQVQKSYLAIVHGAPSWQKIDVDEPLGYEPIERKKIAINGVDAKSAQTHFELLGTNGEFSLLRARPHTGRMHQIRVHAKHLGLPLVGDEAYGGKKDLADGTHLIGRAALHSESLTFKHPSHGEPATITAPLWRDMREFLQERGIEVSKREE